jgi:hypothetical protein
MFFYFFNCPLSYAQSRSWIISLRVYFPALEGIRFRMSGRLGNMGRMNPGILSYIAWTPEMISLASFSSILVPLRAVFILLALIFFLTSHARSIWGIYRFFRLVNIPFPDQAMHNDQLSARVEAFLSSVKRSSKTTAEYRQVLKQSCGFLTLV